MSRIASGMQPSIRRGSLMRYKTLWEGSNQAQADGLLAWERVLRAQAQQPDMDEAITKRVDHLNSAPLEDTELDNLTVAQFVARELGKELKYKMHDAPESRPGHDLRYSLDGSKLRALGWKLPLTFEDSLRKTISWTLANPSWLDVESFKGMPRADDAPPIVRTAGAGVTAAIKAKL